MVQQRVGQQVAHAFDDVYLQVGPLGQDASDGHGQHEADGAGDRPDAYGAAREAAQRVDFLGGLFGLALQQRGVGQQRLPEAGQHHAGGVALEQRGADLVFQPADGAAEGRLGDVQRLCRPAQRPVLDHGQESVELAYIESHAKR